MVSKIVKYPTGFWFQSFCHSTIKKIGYRKSKIFEKKIYVKYIAVKRQLCIRRRFTYKFFYLLLSYMLILAGLALFQIRNSLLVYKHHSKKVRILFLQFS